MENPVKNEPIIILGAIAAITQVLIGVFSHHVETTSVTAAITAIVAIFQRSQVTPVAKLPKKRKR